MYRRNFTKVILDRKKPCTTIAKPKNEKLPNQLVKYPHIVALNAEEEDTCNSVQISQMWPCQNLASDK